MSKNQVIHYKTEKQNRLYVNKLIFQRFTMMSKRTHMTLGGETESSNPSRLMFSIKIPDL